MLFRLFRSSLDSSDSDHPAINHSTLANEDRKVFSQSIETVVSKNKRAAINPIPPFATGIVTDDAGEECTVMKMIPADDIFAGMDVEMEMGAQVLPRLNYTINKERLMVEVASTM